MSYFNFIIFIKHKEHTKITKPRTKFLQSIPIVGMGGIKNVGDRKAYIISLTFQETSCLALKIEYDEMSSDLVNLFLNSVNFTGS